MALHEILNYGMMMEIGTKREHEPGADHLTGRAELETQMGEGHNLEVKIAAMVVMVLKVAGQTLMATQI